jgi:hypothetical protein
MEDDWSDVEVTAPPPAAAAPPPPAPAPSPPPRSFEPIELPEEGPAVAAELAPMHEFVPEPKTTGHQPEPAVPQGGRGFTPGHAAATGDGGEALLREALSQASREVIERVVWEVVPQLAETIIRENLDRLAAQRQA